MLQLLALLIPAMTIAESVMIPSDRVTRWGNWGYLDQCPPGSFVKAINIKTESWQGRGDDSALNAVHLSCVKLNYQVTSRTFPVTKVLKSAEGPWGQFRGLDICYKGVAIGFVLKSEEWIRKGDDTAANDMRLICANRNGHAMTPIRGQVWGTWRNRKMCPAGTAVCGLRTQVEPRQGKGDDTALNNVDLKCCEVPNPAETCKPDDRWQEFLRRDNTRGTSPMQYEFVERVGVRNTLSVSQSSSVSEEIAMSVGFSLKANYGFLGINFETKLSTSRKTHHTWSRHETNVFTVERTRKEAISVPAGCNTRLYQIIGSCGPFVVNSAIVKREDRCLNRRRDIHVNTTYYVIS